MTHRPRIIYRLIAVLVLFALLVTVPYTFSVIRHVQKLIHEEEQIEEQVGSEEYQQLHRDFTGRLLSETLPFLFYMIILAFVISMIFLRKMLVSLNDLEAGSQALRDGRLDTRLKVISEDELGRVTSAFNEMASSLHEQTSALKRKEMYINAMVDPLWVVDNNNQIVDINPAFTRLFGYQHDEVVGLSVYDLLDTKNAAILLKQIEEKRDKGISSTYEMSITRKDGVQIPVLVSGSPIVDGGQIVAKIGIIKDFREQSSLRAELQQSLDYIEGIMDSIQDELLVIDHEYRIVSANKIASGKGSRLLTGQKCHAVMHHQDAPCWQVGEECPVQAVFATGSPHRTTHRHYDHDGTVHAHEIVASPVKDSSGKVLYAIELLRDVTERIRREEEIDRKNSELQALNSVSSILSQSLRPEDIFAKVLERVSELFQMSGGGIFFADETEKNLVCRYHKGISDEYVTKLGRIRYGDDIPGKAVATGQMVISADIASDTAFERSMLQHAGIRAYCCIPLKGKERIIGLLSLFSFEPRSFSDEETRILYSISEMISMAIENVRLYESMRDLYEFQRKRREDEHERLLQLSSRLGAATELKDILSEIITLIREFFHADYAWILTDDQHDNLVLVADSGGGAGTAAVVYPSGTSSFEAYALSRRLPALEVSLDAEGRYYLAPKISSGVYRSAVAIPMFIGLKSVGVLSLYFSVQKKLREDELHFLEIIANVLAVSMQRSEFYLKSMLEKGYSETILQSVADGIITTDASATVLSVNRAFERMVGIFGSKTIGAGACDVFRYHENNRPFRMAFGTCIEAALAGATKSAPADLITAYGNTIGVLISSAPILNTQGAVNGVVSLIRDVSREREIDRMKTEIVRSVSHEFRTPLSAIVGMTEMIMTGDVDGERAQEYLGVIHDEGLRLSQMVAEFLSIARIESGKEGLQLSPLDLRKMIGKIRESFLSVIEDKKAVIDDSGIIENRIVGDEEKITQVLMNIVDNALTFSDEACIIRVETERVRNEVHIRVIDNGWGIPEGELPRLGEPFFRGKHGERTKGTGLGLALCREIVRMHGGGMEISSNAGSGTAVTLKLPAREVA